MYTTGTATSNVDLLSKLHTFLTATLPSNERWVSQRNVTTSGSEEVILRGVGGGSDFIYIGLKAYSDSASDNYGLILNGYTGFNSGLNFYSQPGTMEVSTGMVALPLSGPSASNIAYWFIANSRRVIIIAKVGTRYHQAYLGFGIPYGTPTQWPYPLYIGGSAAVRTSGNDAGIAIKGTTSSTAIHAFWKPVNSFDGISGLSVNVGNLAVKAPDGTFRRPYLLVSGTGSSACSGTWPYVEGIRGTYGGIINLRTTPSGSNYTLNPIIIVEGNPPNMWGEFDGIKHVTGYNLNSESVITVGGESWLCIQDVYRDDDDSMAAYKLA